MSVREFVQENLQNIDFFIFARYFKYKKDDEQLAWDHYTSALATLSQDDNKEVKTLARKKKDEAMSLKSRKGQIEEFWLNFEIENAQKSFEANMRRIQLKNQIIDAERHHQQFSKNSVFPECSPIVSTISDKQTTPSTSKYTSIEESEEESNHSPPAKPEDIMLDEKSSDELFDEDEENDEDDDDKDLDYALLDEKSSDESFDEDEENEMADDDKDLDYVPKSTDSASGSKRRRKSSEEVEESDISEKDEYQDEPTAKRNRRRGPKHIKRKYVLEWNLYEDLKEIVAEWTIDDTNVSDAFIRFKGFAESKADRHELTFSDHPGEILALNSIFLMEENSVRVQLDISPAIRTKIFEQMRAIYPKHDLPKVVEEICRRCVRKQTREALEEEIDNAYYDLRMNLSPYDKKLLRISQNVWNHIAENWRTSFDDPRAIEDTHVHHSIHPFLRPFFPDGSDRTIDWANKMSFASASRKTNDKGEGHKPDFTITVNKRSGKFEVVFGLFKSPYKSSPHFANVDLVDLGVLMKDSLDNTYKEKGIELDMAVFGIHAFGYNVRIYAMDLSYDAVYRMYLIGEFELPKSNISMCLVENALREVGNLKNFVEEYIEKLPSYNTNNENIIKTPTEKMRMTRKTVATPRKVELKLGDV